MPYRHAFTTARRVPFARSVRAALLSTLLVATVAAGQATGDDSRTADAECSCLEDFDALVRHLETNYVGYPLYVTGDRAREFERLQSRLREIATTASPDDCIFVVRELTAWFGDDHLFIIEQPQIPADSAARLAAEAERSARDTGAVMRRLRDRDRTGDPIEGVWFDKHGLRVVIARDDQAPAGDLVAVVLSDTTSGWAPGHIKARFARHPDGSYAATVYGADHAPRHYTARLYRDLMLHMPPLTWGREVPDASDEVVLDPTDPRAPVLRILDADNVLLSIPSHDPAYRPRLDSLVARHDSALRSARTLIIDLRGNEGGSSLTTRSLTPFLRTAEQRPSLGSQGPPAILVSDDNLEYFKRLGVPDSMLTRLAADKGKVVEVPSPRPNTDADTLPELDSPARVAMLVDGGVVSAGEAFLLSAMRNTKVTVFGENTGGVIDLQNVRIVRLACRGRGLLLGYPTIAASANLPAGGLNATGIAPHVRIPDTVEDPITFITDYFARTGGR